MLTTLRKPPSATSYEGTEADDQFCTASVARADFTSTWTASSWQDARSLAPRVILPVAIEV